VSDQFHHRRVDEPEADLVMAAGADLAPITSQQTDLNWRHLGQTMYRIHSFIFGQGTACFRFFRQSRLDPLAQVIRTRFRAQHRLILFRRAAESIMPQPQSLPRVFHLRS